MGATTSTPTSPRVNSTYNNTNKSLRTMFISITDYWFKRLIKENPEPQSVKYIYDIFTQYYNQLDRYRGNSLSKDTFDYLNELTKELILKLKYINPRSSYWAYKITRNTPNYEVRRDIIITDNDIRVFETDLRELEDSFITKGRLQDLKSRRNAPPPLSQNEKQYSNSLTAIEKEILSLKSKKRKYETVNPWSLANIQPHSPSNTSNWHTPINPLYEAQFNRIRSQKAIHNITRKQFNKAIEELEQTKNSLKTNYERRTALVKTRQGGKRSTRKNKSK